MFLIIIRISNFVNRRKKARALQSVLKTILTFRFIFKIESRSVSRVLSWTIIYLDAGLLLTLKPLFVTRRASVQLQSALLRIGFTGFRRSRETGELLPRLSTLTANGRCRRASSRKKFKPFAAVYLCCTFPKVTLGGR